MTSDGPQCPNMQKPNVLSTPTPTSVVCVVYDASVKRTFENVADVWLPLVREATSERPHTPCVVVVGNKSELRAAADRGNFDIPNFLKPLMARFPEVETGLECSARHMEVRECGRRRGSFGTKYTDSVFLCPRAEYE